MLLPAQNQNLDYLSINLPVNCLSSQHSCFSSGVLAVVHSTRDFCLLLASSCVIDRRGAALTMQPGPCSALHLSEGASILPLSIFFPLQSFLFSKTEWKTWEVEGWIEQETCIVRPSMLPGPWIVRNTENQRTALAHRSSKYTIMCLWLPRWESIQRSSVWVTSGHVISLDNSSVHWASLVQFSWISSHTSRRLRHSQYKDTRLSFKSLFFALSPAFEAYLNQYDRVWIKQHFRKQRRKPHVTSV